METVELRVHGVHGTSPGAMLGLSDGEVGQVAGDKVTGIYRSKDGKLPYRSLEIPGPHPQPRISVEAYSWGALTSGVQGVLGWLRRACWLLLLPFALANLAYWARLEVGQSRGRARWGARAVRVSGVLLTIFMVLTPCVIAIDMIGWQCYRREVPRCAHLPSQLNVLADWSAAQRLAATSLVPVLAIGLLWLLSRNSLSRYEATPLPSHLGSSESMPILRDQNLWSGMRRTERLQRLHLAAAICAVVVFVGIHFLHAAPMPEYPPTFPLTGWKISVYTVGWTTSAACLLIVLCVALTLLNHTDDLENRAPSQQVHTGRSALVWWLPNRLERLGYVVGKKVRLVTEKATGVLTLLALVLYALQTIVLVRYDGSLDQSASYYGHNTWFITLFVLLTALHLSVFAGGRMWTSVAIAFVVAPVIIGGIVAKELHERGKWQDSETLYWALGIVGVWWVLLTLWHFLIGGRKHTDAAWRGAGASVFLAAAAWIALLFTSSAVIASANYLNGPDRSVSDLVTRLPPSVQADPDQYIAAGDVKVRKAHVVVTKFRVRVYSGTVTADRFTKRDAESGLVQRIGTTSIRGPVTLVLPKGDLGFEQSCIKNPTTPLDWLEFKCTAEEDTYQEAGELAMAGRKLYLERSAKRGDESTKVTMQPIEQLQTPLVVPQVLVWTPLGQLAWLVLVGIGVLICVGLFTGTAARKVKDNLPIDGGGGCPDQLIPERDRCACRSKRSAAALGHRAETLLDVIGSITAPIALVVIVCSMTGEAPWDRWDVTRQLATASMYVVVAASAGLVLLGSQIRRSESTRKAVGVIWDLATFWPRAAHPLAPPCYAERVVPELETRTRWALEADPANQLVLSGHSQGSLIVASMASRLDDDLLGRTHVITYGSQIRALYGRVFPRVFGAGAIGYRPTKGQPSLVDAFPDVPRDPAPDGPPPAPADSLRGRIEAAGGSWVNLFRRSDPLGFRVFSDVDSDLDRPVPEVPRYVVGDPGPQVMTHSGYQHTEVYRRAVSGWTGEVYVEDRTETTDLPILPPL